MIQFTKSGHQLLSVQLRCLDNICMKPNIQGHTAAPCVVMQACEEVMNSYITQLDYTASKQTAVFLLC